MTQRKPRPAPGISTNSLWIVVATLISIPIILVVVRSFYLQPTKPLPEIQCSDGPRRLIDATQFETQYWAYSMKLEGSVGDKGKIAAVLEPKILQQLSDAIQQGNEFHKLLVASYNACAMTRAHYEQYAMTFQEMDNAARSIQDTLDKGVKTTDARATLAALVNTYLQAAGSLQTSSTRSNP